MTMFRSNLAQLCNHVVDIISQMDLPLLEVL
jgi:hypothetical protein